MSFLCVIPSSNNKQAHKVSRGVSWLQKCTCPFDKDDAVIYLKLQESISKELHVRAFAWLTMHSRDDDLELVQVKEGIKASGTQDTQDVIHKIWHTYTHTHSVSFSIYMLESTPPPKLAPATHLHMSFHWWVNLLSTSPSRL